MIFERLVLHNFGAYQGEHVIDLSVSPGKPVVLVGALNGSGKTTLLEATQLALFGRAVRGTSRAKMAYPEYLQQLINRNVSPESGASVGLTFSHRHAGHNDTFTLTRTWRKAGAAVKEELEVLRNGVLDVEATGRWLEFVEEFMPVQLADLFLFDGERIEALADPERSAEFLKSGIHALLGLDLVDHLTRTLTVLERRKRSSRSDSKVQRDRLEQREAVLDGLLKQCTELTGQRAATQNQIDTGEKRLSKLRQRLVKEGGDLHADRDRIAGQATLAAAAVESRALALSEMAAGDAPLLLVPEMLEAAQRLTNEAEVSATAVRIHNVLSERDDALIRYLETAKVSKNVKTEIGRLLESTRADWLGKVSDTPALGLSPAGFAGLSPDALAGIRTAVRAQLAAFVREKDVMEAAVARRLAIPSEDGLRVLLDDVVAAERELTLTVAKGELLDAELVRLTSQANKAKEAVERARLDLHSVDLDASVDARIVNHSTRARETLAKFRTAVAERNVARLESLITEQFQTLLRKRDCLVERVCIDPQSFDLRLRDREGRTLDPMLLSAGERQLLAVAIVWALAKASGRTLPTMIDTPLGRLDGDHRSKLVESYFPQASHQVILLSTDEEINGKYYAQLQSRVAREYLISFDPKTRSSRFENGYFVQTARAVA